MRLDSALERIKPKFHIRKITHGSGVYILGAAGSAGDIFVELSSLSADPNLTQNILSNDATNRLNTTGKPNPVSRCYTARA